MRQVKVALPHCATTFTLLVACLVAGHGRQARDHTHKREIGTDQQIKNVAQASKSPARGKKKKLLTVINQTLWYGY